MVDDTNKYSAEATFRGFRAQTLYILNRIIKDTEKFEFLPEGNEDLDIYIDDNLIELVQVKYYGDNLTLSKLEPEKESSFFRRSLNRLKDGSKPKITLISFGPIGPELENGFKFKGKDRTNIQTKLQEKEYEIDDINLILDNVIFVKVDEENLEGEIFNYLKESHAGLDPKVCFDYLMNWIYQLSERAEKVNKIHLVEKINNIATFLSEVSNYREEFGLSVNHLELPKEIHPYERLEEEFYSGIHTRYEHIIADLDVRRNAKLSEMEEKFKDNNVLIMHGASGQGKSTLAYRFLYEYYPNALTYEIRSKERDALRIIQTLNAISKSIDEQIAIFIDVEPTDNVWPDIVKKISRYPKFNILISIREEDWKRTSFSSADLIYSEIELSLTKEEAEEIYENLTLKNDEFKFLDFEESWLKFGGKGPLLEFTYLLTQGITLRARLEQQVGRIREEAHKFREIERLELLRIVSIIGMYGCKTDLEYIISKIKLKDPVHVLRIFQEEYLIREEPNGKYLGALHPIRSKILVEILSDPVVKPIKNDIGLCLSVIDENDIKIFLLNCFIEFGLDDEILKNVYSFIPISWISYGLIIETLLWLGVKNYLDVNNDVINEAQDKIGSGWNLFVIPDLTNASDIKKYDIIDSDLVSVERKKEIIDLRRKLTDKSLIYKFLEIWLTTANIPHKKPETGNEWQNLGLSLFWHGRLDIIKEISFSEYPFDRCFNILPLDCIVDFMLGLQYFDSENDIIEEYRSQIVERIKKELLIPLIEDDRDKITLHTIIDVVGVNSVSNSHENIMNELVMYRITLIRKLYCERTKFANRSYGNKISFLELDIDDTKKDIPIENLPLEWLTTINATFHELVEYKFRPDNWEEYIFAVAQSRVDSLAFIKKLIENLQIFFRKSGKVEILNLNSLNVSWNNLALNLEAKPFPKSSIDLLNIKSHKSYEKDDYLEESNLMSFRFDKYNKSYNSFIANLRNFLNQGPSAIILQSQSKGKSHDQIEIIKKRLEEQGIRIDFNYLSLINLYEVFKNLLVIQVEFNDLFGKNVLEYDLKDIEENEFLFYGLLTELWRTFVIDGYKKNKKIVKIAKDKFRNEKENVTKNIIKSLEKEKLGVKLISKSFENYEEKYLILNVSDPFKIDETVKKVIKTLKNDLNDVLPTDLRKLFLDIEFDIFKIIILVEGKLLLPIYYNFPLYRAINPEYSEIGILDLVPKPLESKIGELGIEKWQDKISYISKLDKVFKLENLQLLIYHLKQLVDLDLDDLGFEITQNYANKISELISKDFQEVLGFLEISIELLNRDISTLKESYKKDKADLKKLDEEKEEKMEILEFLEEINEKLIPGKPDSSGKIEIVTKLKNIDEWYTKIDENKDKIYYIYLYYTNQLISEYLHSET